MPKQDIIRVHLKRDGDNSIVKIWVSPEVEAAFKRMSADENKEPHYAPSRKWKDQSGQPLRFYQLQHRIDLRMQEDGAPIFNKYGSDLIDDRNRCNIAILRTVGASVGDGISISTDEMLSVADLNYWCETISVFCRTFYKAYVQEAEYNAVITFEV